jgi:hypothetical protein
MLEYILGALVVLIILLIIAALLMPVKSHKSNKLQKKMWWLPYSRVRNSPEMTIEDACNMCEHDHQSHEQGWYPEVSDSLAPDTLHNSEHFDANMGKCPKCAKWFFGPKYYFATGYPEGVGFDNIRMTT